MLHLAATAALSPPKTAGALIAATTRRPAVEPVAVLLDRGPAVQSATRRAAQLVRLGARSATQRVVPAARWKVAQAAAPLRRPAPRAKAAQWRLRVEAPPAGPPPKEPVVPAALRWQAPADAVVPVVEATRAPQGLAVRPRPAVRAPAVRAPAVRAPVEWAAWLVRSPTTAASVAA
ncbi:MAG: hypothetical protein ABIS92_06190 [Polyangia bacterium]